MSESINERVGERIRFCRERAGLTPKQAAEQAGFGYARWVNWENGVRGIGVELFPTIARVIKSTPEYLACFTDSEENRAGQSQFLTLAIPGEPSSRARLAWSERELLARALSPVDLVQTTVADAALEPDISAGDVALVDRAVKQFAGNGVYALLVDGTLLLRWIHQSPLNGDLVVSASDKKRWPDEVVAAGRAQELRIYGRLAGRWHWENWQD